MMEEGLLGQFYDASFGLVYPVLNALLKQEYVSVIQVAQEKWSDKKTNSLTPVGPGFFKRALVKPPTKDKIHSGHVPRLFCCRLYDQTRFDCRLRFLSPTF